MRYNVKFFVLFFLSILVSFLLLPLNGTAQLPCEPPNVPTLIAPSHNIWIWYDPVFQAEVSDPAGDDVRAYFSISGYGTGWGSWVNSGGISEWGPVNLGTCAQYDWQARAQNSCGVSGSWSSYWRIGIDKNLPTSDINYPAGIINYTTFTVNLIESEDCSGIRRGAVYYRYGLSPEELGRWWFYNSDIDDFNFTGQDGYSYQFRYRVQDLAGNWSNYIEGGIVTIRITNPPDTPVLQAPPNNTWINYDPIFQAQITDLDNDDVQAYFSITDDGANWGNWVESGGISEWGPVNLGTCAEHSWRAYAQDARNLTSDWTDYWLVRVDKDAPTSSINYPTGTIDYTIFTVSLTESDNCSGINNGDLEISIDGGSWQNYSNTINDFDYTGENGLCYQFRYQVQDNAENWSSWDEGGQVCIQLPVPTVNLTADPPTIEQGQSSTLTWSSTDANSCSAPWTSSTAPSDSQPVSPSSTTIYNITCSGDGGSASDSVTITVTIPLPPSVSLTVDDSIIDQGDSTTLRWSSSDADNCAALWTLLTDPSGFQSVSPNTTTIYSITCTGPGGSASDSATITVIIPPPPPVPTVNLGADDLTIDQGDSTTLRWSSTNADDGCSAPWTSLTTPSGSQPVSPSSTTIYNITCSGAGGSASDSVMVEVRAGEPPPPPPPPAPTVNLSANPSSIEEEQLSTLRWSSANADSCSAPWTSSTAASGNQSVSPNVTTSYSITCTGEEGSASDSVTITVTAPVPPGPPPPGLVPCGRSGLPPCGLCHFLVLGKNIVNFGVKLVSSLAVLAIVIGGILILTARGSVNQATIGKKLIHYAIMGTVIALASWAIVNLIVGFLAPDVFLFPWDEIDCPQ